MKNKSGKAGKGIFPNSIKYGVKSFEKWWCYKENEVKQFFSSTARSNGKKVMAIKVIERKM